jgi:hypothetical protein
LLPTPTTFAQTNHISFKMPSAITTFPETRQAIVASEAGEWIIASNLPTPEPSATSALIRTEAFAINPSDTKMVRDSLVAFFAPT